MHRFKRLTGLVVAIVALSMIPAAAAQADPFELDISDAVLDLGGLSGVKAIDSSIPDPPATLDGTITGTSVTVPKAGFVFPTKSAEVAAGIMANIDMEANNDITGTFDAGTGVMSLDVSLKATVAIPSLSSTCVINPIALTLSTENAKPYLGEKFSSGLSGAGAVSAKWDGLPPVTGGGFCTTVAGLIAGPGGIWMAQDIATPKTCADVPSDERCSSLPPEKKPTITAGPPSTTDATSAEFKFTKAVDETQDVSGFSCRLDEGAFEACDSGTKSYSGLSVGTHTFTVKAKNSHGEGPESSQSWSIEQKTTPPGSAKFAVNVKLKPKKVKRGKKATLTVKVKNTGNATAAGTKICVKAPAKLVKVKKCTNVGSIAAGKAKTKKIVVKAKRKKGTAKLTVTVSGKGVAKKTAKPKLKIR